VLAKLPRAAAAGLLARMDRAVPGRIEGFYVVGSASMGAFQAGRSDLDFVAIVDGPLEPAELRRLRRLHFGCWMSALVRDTVLRRRWPLVGNGVYLTREDLSCSSLDVTPLAGHVAGRFRAARRDRFDVNPVTWYVLARHGVALRGPDRDRLHIHTDDAELRTWVLANLNGYWRDWAERTRGGGRDTRLLPARRLAAWGVLGAPRLHYTVATGDVATKEAAAHYALEVFESRWHGLIEDAIAFWRGEPPSGHRQRPPSFRQEAADFVDYVVDAGNRLESASNAA
jgi:hypothetical protein